MTTLKTELKVAINCEKCKAQVLQAVTKLTGVDEVTVNAEKGIATVIGTVDPVCVTAKVRKTGRCAEIMTVGPPKKPEPPKPKIEEKPKPPCEPLPACCKQCQLVGVFVTYDRDPYCSIL